MVGVGSTAVAVGTDAVEVVELLEPWRIHDFDESAIELVDYGIELHAAATDHDGSKPLHRLARGSCTLISSRDPRRITHALLNCVATHEAPPGPGRIRIELTPLLRDGHAVLAPPRRVLALSERWLDVRGITRIDTVSVILDPDALTVAWDSPLGSDESPEPVPVMRWFLPVSRVEDVEFTPGMAVAHAMGLALECTAENAAWNLEQLARCVQRLPTHIAPVALADWNDALDESFTT